MLDPQLLDRIEHLGLGRVGSEVHVDGMTSELCGLGVLHPHVSGTGVVVTDQQRRQPRNTISVAKTIHARLQRSEHGVRNRQRARVAVARVLATGAPLILAPLFCA